MSASTKTRAIVINSRRYGESDLIVTFVTEDHGLVKGLAKGALKSRKRFAGSLEPFTQVELRLALKPDALARVDAADIIDAHLAIREDLDRIQAASCLVELAMLVEPPPTERAEAFGLVASGLGAIEASDSPYGLLAVYAVKYLSAAGFGIHTETCSECGARITGEPFYRGGEGLLCKRCAGQAGRALSAGLTAFIGGARSVEPGKAGRIRLSPALLREFNLFAAEYVRAVSGREPRSFSVINAPSLA